MNQLIWQMISGILSVALVLSWYLIHLLRKALKKSLEREERSYLELLDFPTVNPNPVLRIDKFGKVLYANPPSAPILAFWNISLNEKIPPEWREILRQVSLSKKSHALELSCTQSIYLLNIVPMKNGYASIFGTDITDLKNIEIQLIKKSTHDEITQLPNRIIFLQNLNLEILHAKKAQTKLGIFIIRLDDYKEIQNTYGQEIANRFLTIFCKRLGHLKEDQGTLARLNDNEFGVIEPKCQDPATIVSIVQSVIEKTALPYSIDGHDIFITLSIGIAFYPGDGENAEILLRNAQLAIERTSSTRNQYEFFQRGMDEQLQIKRNIISDLHHALAENQFVVYYQPQIQLSTQKMIGCEALIRWNHPKKGFISPFFFVTAAEETQLILPLGEWILNRACEQIITWKGEGKTPIKVAVNVSARQLFQGDIVACVQKAILNSGISPECLELELTESALVQDIDKAIEIMKSLKDLGVALALDDFGTGYSSLSYLMKFPVNKLKIDRSFIKIIEDEKSEKYTLTKGIIELGHSLHLKIVAEGVETQTQLDFLIKNKCDIVQGYYYAQPQPAERFNEFFKNEWKK